MIDHQDPCQYLYGVFLFCIHFYSSLPSQPQAIDPLLRNCMSELLVPLCDPELGVRRVALVAFNSAAHNKPSLIRDLLPHVLPTIYSETKVKVCVDQ